MEKSQIYEKIRTLETIILSLMTVVELTGKKSYVIDDAIEYVQKYIQAYNIMVLEL